MKENKNIIVRILRCIFRIIKFCIFKPKMNPCENYGNIPIETTLPERSKHVETKKKPVTVIKKKTRKKK